MYTPYEHNPACDGPITAIAFSNDRRHQDNTAGGPALRQNETNYRTNINITDNADWQTFTGQSRDPQADLTEADFWVVATDTTNNPDFSAEGTPIQFGYVRAKSGSVGGPWLSFTDNWSMTLTVGTPPTYSVGGTISGLEGTLTLQNNGTDDLTVTATGTFTFETGLGCDSEYSVTVLEQPLGQTCVINAGVGQIGNAAGSNVVGVEIACTDDPPVMMPDAGTTQDAGIEPDAGFGEDAGQPIVDAAEARQAPEDAPEDGCACNALTGQAKTNSLWGAGVLFLLILARRRRSA